jgi:hypothetical protein
MLEEYDVSECQWCRGDGKDHGTLGMGTVRDCLRCAGSGRVYKGPAPRAGLEAARQQQELTETLRKPRRRIGTPRMKNKKRRKSARRHAA